MRDLKFFLLMFGLSMPIIPVPDDAGRSHDSHLIRRASSDKEAIDFWTQARTYPFEEIPADKFYTEFIRARSRIGEPTLSIQTSPPWKSLGPTNVPGRMLSIAVNPKNRSTVYAGSASAGLWRSYSGGTKGDWKRIPLGYPVLGVSSIAIDPADTNIIYIGTGETYRYQCANGGVVIRTMRGSYGLGILKTTNGGATWTKSLDWTLNNQRGVWMVRIHPRNSNSLFAATTDGVFRSLDAGTTWTKVLQIPMATDIAIYPNDTSRVLVACGNFASQGGGIYRSTDGGWSYFRISDLPAYSGKAMLDVYAASPNVVYADLADSTTGSGSLWRSTDFGTRWIRLAADNNYGVQGWYSHYVEVHPSDSSLVFRGTVGMYRSTDGGRNFVPVGGLHSDHHGYAHDPIDPNIIYDVNDAGVGRSTNFGTSFQSVSRGLVTSQIYNGFSNSTTDSNLALGQFQDNGGWFYRGSLSWTSSGTFEAGWTAIHPVNDSIMYATSEEGSTIFKSTNRGSLFAWVGLYFGGIAAWNGAFLLSPSSPDVLYYGRSIVYKSTNGGSAWSSLNGGRVLDGNPALSMAIAHTSPDTLYIGTGPIHTRPHIFRTTDGGTSWTDITSFLPNRYPMDIAVDPNDSRTVYIAFGGFDTSHVFKSTDAGENWTDITGMLPDVPATALLVDPENSNHVYVGTDIGVYVSTLGGARWTSFSEGLPEAVIAADLSLSPVNRTLRVATHGSGAYERKLLHGGPTEVSTNDATRRERPVFEENYPNPFNSTTRFRFSITDEVFVSLTIYDVLGREITVLISGRLETGTHSVEWDTKGFPSGVYFVRFDADSYSVTKKILMIR